MNVSECVVIQAGVEHAFQADEAARFIVADMQALPENLVSDSPLVFSITAPLVSFLLFVEKQLEHQVDSGIETSMLGVFYMLLQQQGATHCLDRRIRAVQTKMIEQLDQPLSIAQLAEVACLSPTQFKKRFKESLGVSVHQYLIQQRMEKAKALLTHTDLPVQLIAQRVGYGDLSAFSRRFSLYFGLSPRAFASGG